MTDHVPNIELLGSPGKASLAAHIALREAGLPFVLRLVDVDAHYDRFVGATVPDDKLSQVPILTIDGVSFRETLAILVYIQPWLDRGVDDLRCDLNWLAWLSYMATTVHPAFSQVARPNRFAVEGEWAVRVGGLRNVHQLVLLIEADLFGADFAWRERFSVLDAYLATAFRWVWRVDPTLLELCPGWCLWARAIAGRPAVSDALAAEGIAMFPHRKDAP